MTKKERVVAENIIPKDFLKLNEKEEDAESKWKDIFKTNIPLRSNLSPSGECWPMTKIDAVFEKYDSNLMG